MQLERTFMSPTAMRDAKAAADKLESHGFEIVSITGHRMRATLIVTTPKRGVADDAATSVAQKIAGGFLNSWKLRP